MSEGLSIAALVLAVFVTVWQWRVTQELSAIRSELEHIRYGNGKDDMEDEADHPETLEDDALDDASIEVFPLFAEAVDPNSDVTTEDVEEEWGR